MPDNELRSLRIELGLPARDMVAVVPPSGRTP